MCNCRRKMVIGGSAPTASNARVPRMTGPKPTNNILARGKPAASSTPQEKKTFFDSMGRLRTLSVVTPSNPQPQPTPVKCVPLLSDAVRQINKLLTKCGLEKIAVPGQK